MGASPAALEESLRAAVRSSYYHGVAFVTLSILGGIVLVPVITIGHAILGVTYASGTILSRGTPHTAREAVRLFRIGIRRSLVEGVLLSVTLISLVGLLVGNMILLTTEGTETVLIAFTIASVLLITASVLVALYAVALVACGQSPAASARDSAVLAIGNPVYTLLLGVLVVTILVLGALTLVVGWAVIGFAFTSAFVLYATDTLYETESGESPLEAVGK